MVCNCDCFDQGEYDQSLCGCCGDLKACICAFAWVFACCPCASCIPAIATGHYVGISEGTDFNTASCLCSSLGAYRLRRNIAARHQRREPADGSILAVSCCFPCALAQDFHEIKHLEKRRRDQLSQLPPQMVTMPMAPAPGSPMVVAQPYYSSTPGSPIVLPYQNHGSPIGSPVSPSYQYHGSPSDPKQ